MENALGLVAALFIAAVFFLVATYYLKLYAFLQSLRKNDQALWLRWRSAARPRDLDLKVAYRILMDSSASASLSDESRAICKVVRRYLYTTLILFMMLLFFGLAVSVEK